MFVEIWLWECKTLAAFPMFWNVKDGSQKKAKTLPAQQSTQKRRLAVATSINQIESSELWKAVILFHVTSVSFALMFIVETVDCCCHSLFFIAASKDPVDVMHESCFNG